MLNQISGVIDTLNEKENLKNYFESTDIPTPVVGIGMPVYNGARYIRQTIISLLNQTVTDFHITICDDGSTDETPAICQEFARRDSRITVVVNTERLGGAKNFNRTFELSQGKYFMWASQDDVFHPTYIEKCLAKIELSPQAVMALTEIEFINEVGVRSIMGDDPNYTNIDTEGLAVAERLHEVFCRTGWWAIYGLIRPEILRKTKLYRNEFAGDVILIVELLLHGEFVKVPEALFYYRVRTRQPFTINNNLQSIDHTQEVSKKAYTDFMKSIVRCIVEFDLNPATRQQIITDMLNTLILRNSVMRNNILEENMGDLIALAVGCDNIHEMTVNIFQQKFMASLAVNDSN